MKKNHLFITGATGFIGQEVLNQIGSLFGQTKSLSKTSQIFLLVRKSSEKKAINLINKSGLKKITSIIISDLGAEKLNFQPAQVKGKITHVLHLAARYQVSAPKAELKRINVQGTEKIINFAKTCSRLRVFAQMSTAYVSGLAEGKIFEDELIAPSGFHNDYEESKFIAERLVRAEGKKLPVMIFRPSIVVGHSKTGSFGKMDGAYKLLKLIDEKKLLFYPGPCRAPFHLVPVDYVARAIINLLFLPQAVGKTFHLIDPCPWSVRQFIKKSAGQLGRAEPLFNLPLFLINRFPLARSRKQLSLFNQTVVFDNQNTDFFLAGKGINCPPLASYFPIMIKSFRKRIFKQRND